MKTAGDVQIRKLQYSDHVYTRTSSEAVTKTYIYKETNKQVKK